LQSDRGSASDCTVFREVTSAISVTVTVMAIRWRPHRVRIDGTARRATQGSNCGKGERKDLGRRRSQRRSQIFERHLANGGGECTGPPRPRRLLAGATNRTEFPTGRPLNASLCCCKEVAHSVPIRPGCMKRLQKQTYILIGSPAFPSGPLTPPLLRAILRPSAWRSCAASGCRSQQIP